MEEKYTTVCWALLGTGRNKPGVSFIFSYYKIAQLQHTFLNRAKHCGDFCGCPTTTVYACVLLKVRYSFVSRTIFIS